MLLATFAIIYALWVIFYKIDGDSHRFVKFSPIVILLLSINSLVRNLFTLNSMKLTKDKISFRYIGKRAVNVDWTDFTKMILANGKRKAVCLIYMDKGEEKDFRFFLSFPHILEVINSIAECSPHIELDEFMGTIVVSKKEKDMFQKANFDKEKIDESK